MIIDTGNTAFMLLCSSLVMLMTPGLAFFYGGLVGRKNVLAIMIQSFVSMGWTTVLWWAFGFSVCFSGDLKSGTDFFGVLGNFHWAFLRGITLDTPSLINPSIPMIVFCAYQMMFAIITPALITGAFANRVTFKAYMLFLTGWLTLVYFPFVHMVWGGGMLAVWGVLDFAGGIVVHNIAGNSRSSSGGESRIIRMGYGADEIYTRSAHRALRLWQELFARVDQRLFHRTGVLWLAHDDDPYPLQTAETLEKIRIPLEKLTTAEVSRRYPQIGLERISWALLEPEGGILLARRAVQAVTFAAIKTGVEYLQDAVGGTGVAPVNHAQDARASKKKAESY